MSSYEKIAQPEALGGFLASLFIADGPWNAAISRGKFGIDFCVNESIIKFDQ